MPPVKLGEKGLEIFFFQKQRDVGLFKIDSFAEILSPSSTGGISHAALWGSLNLRCHRNYVASSIEDCKKEKVPDRCRGLSPKP